MGSRRNAYHSVQLPTVLTADIDGYNTIIIPTNIKFIYKPRKTLPSFSGSENGALVEDWFQECERAASLLGWHEDIMLQKFIMRLRGDALMYHRKKLTYVEDYWDWRDLMIEEFMHNDKYYFLGQLDQLRQKPHQSVTTFAAEIDSLLVKALGLAVITDKSLKTFCFRVKLAYLIDGLREVIRKEIGPRFHNYMTGFPSWSRVIEEVQDVEWLIDLRKKQSIRNSLQSCNYVKVYLAISGDDETKQMGYGVFFGENDSKNVSKIEPRTCNATLIIAAITAIQQAKKHGIERLMIHTNSEYLLKFIDEWAVPWLENSWSKSRRKLALNVPLWRNLLTALQDIDVKWAAFNENENGPAGARSLASLAKTSLQKYDPRGTY
ncbi:uncharacterized protein LOC130690963 [Daphnia carinata]|uniref:uncharacterized protein LOC130690963 n=1 Tax=Daphnia carinata TaxID=120202 RepID=UPI002580D922|nr:uncharacterized protein LOC130690963 [Daphnia carinata]